MDLTEKNLSPKKFSDRKKRLAKGCTTLMYSCQQGKSNDVVTELRIKPKSVYRRDKSNKSALHYCCGQLDLVAAASVTTAAPELLESADEDGLTPMHLAVIQGNMALVNLLLANKANINAVDNEGHSVVHWATVCGEVDALRALLAAGADISKTDLNGGSPLHYAAQMSNGAGFQSHSPNLALEILDIFLQQPNVQVDVCDKDGRQPLLWAASAGAVKAVLMLVKAGARVESADKDGLTALHCAASRGHTECINVLINLCGAPTDLIDSNGCTALHYAVTLGHADATYVLLDLGADPNRQDRKGRTPAHCGCAKGQFETVKMLRDRKANMWLRNAKGDLPLHEAASSGRRELVLWLLDQRPKHVNTTSNDGRTILHIAAGNDYTDMCKMLIDFGADINSVYRLPGNVVQTPLDCALSKGYRSTAKYLQLHGGLPASKLRLSGRNPNALNDQELVTPLSFSDTKRTEMDTKKTKNVILYVNHSDSETNDTANRTKTSGKDGVVKRHSRKSCDDGRRHHFHHHYRHRCRYRTSSCERIEIHHRDSGPDSSNSNMCRSKSNVEICMFRRKRSKNRREPSTSSTSSVDTCSEDGSSSEIYCRYNKNGKRRRDTGGRGYKEKSEKSTTKGAIKKDKVSSDGNKNQKEKAADKKSNVENDDVKAMNKKRDSKTKQTKGQTPTATAQVKEMNENKQDDGNEKSPVLRDESKSKDVFPNVEADKKPPDESIDKKTPNENKGISAETTFVTKADVHTPVTTEASTHDSKNEQSHEISATTTKISPTEGQDQLISADNIKQSSLEAKPFESTDVEMVQRLPPEKPKTDEIALIESAPIENAKTETVVEPAKEKDHVKFDEKITESAAEPKTVQIQSTDQIEAKTINENEQKETDKKMNTDPIVEVTTTTEDASKSFQVLPKNDESGKKKDQVNDDTGNLVPPTEPVRKTSFTVLKSDESLDDILGNIDENQNIGTPTHTAASKTLNRPKSFKVLSSHAPSGDDILLQPSSDQEKSGNDDDEDYLNGNQLADRRNGKYSDSELIKLDSNLNGRRKKLKKRAKSSVKHLTIADASTISGGGSQQNLNKQQSKDQDSGFEPSPRAMRSMKTASSARAIYTANLPERPRVGDVVDSRSYSSRFEQRKPGDKHAVNMSTVSQTLQRNIRRYYMEHKIFQHLLELKSLQIRSNKVNEPLLVKRAVDDYHKSTMEMGSEIGGTMRRYPYKEYTFKNFEIFLYEVLKSLQKSGTNNFQNISDVYLEAERRLSPDYARCKKAMYCTSKTHRCLHAAHAYTGIPCAAYIPMMNHHTMPKYGFGKTSTGSFYLPRICTKGGGIGGTGKCGSGTSTHNTVSLELSHGNNKQLITLPAEKLDNNKRYYVTFTLKENERAQKDGGITNSSSGGGAAGDNTEQKTFKST